MCYNTKQTRDQAQLEMRFSAQIAPDLIKPNLVQKEFKGFEFPIHPIISNLNNNVITAYTWGLIPHWAKNSDNRKNTLNARTETLIEKPTFQKHKTQRCLVLVNGFYEWMWLDSQGKKKQKYCIGLEDEKPFALAGIWDRWHDNITNKEIFTFSIVTTSAEGIMKEISNNSSRMPLVLGQDDENQWLNGENHMSFKPFLNLSASTENLQLGFAF